MLGKDMSRKKTLWYDSPGVGGTNPLGSLLFLCRTADPIRRTLSPNDPSMLPGGS